MTELQGGTRTPQWNATGAPAARRTEAATADWSRPFISPGGTTYLYSIRARENCFGAEEDLSSGGARRAWEQEEPAAAVEERSGGGLQDYCVLLGMSAAWPNCEGISPKIPDMEVTALWEETQPRSPPGTV